MNLSDLNSGPVVAKSWLNINCNSLNSNIITGSSIFGNVSQICSLNIINSSPTAISASNWVNGIVVINSGSQILNAPDGSALFSYFGSSLQTGLSFTTNIYIKTTSPALTINGGTFTFFSVNNTPTLTVTNSAAILYFPLQYFWTGTSWLIFTTNPSQ